jgi:SAM-dependent methyltransferase
MTFLRHLYNALFRPARWHHAISAARLLARLPVVFDLISLTMQWRDLSRLGRIREKYWVANDPHHRRAQDYNAGVTQAKGITTTRQAEDIYEILALPPRPLDREKLLIVGPRNIQEFLIAWIHGFSWRLMRGIDLYSTNPKIVPMNMEAMTFPDASFDAVGMSATISYAKDVGVCIKEIARVLKPGGRFAFGAPYDPLSVDWKGDHVTAVQMHRLLHEAGFDIYYHHAWDRVSSMGHRQTSHRFAAVKRNPAETLLDPLPL